MDRLYPKATQNRLRFRDKGFKPVIVAFLRAAGRNFVLLQLLFLGLFSYIFGSLFQQSTHNHNLTIAFVDYDAGSGSSASPIGEAILTAYASMAGKTFPTLIERPPDEYPSPASDLRHAVCHTDYWGALYVTAGASGRLQAALNSSSAAEQYDRNDVLFYIWNEARYPTVVDSAISANIQTLAQAARVALAANGTSGSSGIIPWPLSSPAAVEVLANPWTPVAMNIRPTPQGSRAIYNTMVIILILIQEFFYLGIINGLTGAFHTYSKLQPLRILLIRSINSLCYTLVGSLSTTGAIWAFRAGWDVGARQFGLTWMVLWLFAHANFLTLDVFTIWLPPPYVPMALVSWLCMNVTSILLPLELSPAFYRIGYMFPAHEVYQALLDIWSRGCNPQLHIALPVLFAWEVASFVGSVFGVYRRAHYATLADEAQERELHARIDAAMAFGTRRDAMIGGVGEDGEREEEKEEGVEEEEEEKEVSSKSTAAGRGSLSGPSASGTRAAAAGLSRTLSRTEVAALRQDLHKVLTREQGLFQSEQRRVSRACGFGPAFALAFLPGGNSVNSSNSSSVSEGGNGKGSSSGDDGDNVGSVNTRVNTTTAEEEDGA